MTVVFPTALDAFTNPVSSDATNSVAVPHATQHSNANDAIEALEARVGIIGSADTASLTYRIATLEGTGVSSTAWATYTPTWTGASSNPAIGDGTIAGRYKVIGKTLFLHIAITMGASTTYGSGGWSLSLPGSYTTAAAFAVVNGTAYRTNHSPITWVFGGAGSSTGGMYASGGVVSATAPITFATSDLLLLSGSIEVA